MNIPSTKHAISLTKAKLWHRKWSHGSTLKCVYLFSFSCRAHFYICDIYLLNCFLFTWYFVRGSEVLHISSFLSLISHIQWSRILLKSKHFKLTKCCSSRFSHRSSYSLLIILRTLQTTPKSHRGRKRTV